MGDDDHLEPAPNGPRKRRKKAVRELDLTIPADNAVNLVRYCDADAEYFSLILFFVLDLLFVSSIYISFRYSFFVARP